MDINPTNRAYQVYTDTALGEIMNEFSSDYIMSVIQIMLNNTRTLHTTSMVTPNIVSVYEARFNTLMNDLPYEKTNFLEARKNCYAKIIQVICDFYGINYAIERDSSFFTIAYVLFDVFISKFKSVLIQFFSQYIMQNLPNILAMIPQSEFDKVITEQRNLPKSKKRSIIPENELQFSVISNNIYGIVYNICGREIPLYEFYRLGTAYKEDELHFLFDEQLYTNSDFVRERIAPVVLDDSNANILNDIRIQLHQEFFPDGNLGVLSSGDIPVIYKQEVVEP